MQYRIIIPAIITALLSTTMMNCSAITDWELAGLPCEFSDDGGSTDGCLENYSCFVDACIADYSLSEGDDCLKDVQCEEGLFCNGATSSCQIPCYTYFDVGGPCGSVNQLCTPVTMTKLTGYEFVDQGYCISSECTSDSECQSQHPNKICIKFSTNVGRCYFQCDVTFTDGKYSDQYPKETCHPLPLDNLTGDPKLVRYPIGSRQIDDLCHVVKSPCAEGLVCFKSISSSTYACKKLCDFGSLDDGCNTDEVCNSQGNYAICL